MPNLLPHLLPRLTQFRIPGLDLGEASVHPHYLGGCLSNLPASICAWFGIPRLSGSQPLWDDLLDEFPGPFQNIVVLVVDGWGWLQFEKVLFPEEERAAGHAAWTRLLPDGVLAALTSVVPSTTSAALTSLWTGVGPSQHGILGYEMWMKEYGLIANTIFHSPASFNADTGSLKKAGFQPESFLPVPTLGPHLAAHHINPFSFQPSGIARSGLSLMHMPQVNIIPYRTQSDLWVSLLALLESRKNERNYAYLYWGDLDELAHRYGPQDERVLLEFASFSMVLERFLVSLKHRGRGKTLFLMVSDHGQVYTPRLPLYELKNHPGLYECLVMPPSGESRFSYLYARRGREEQIQEYIARNFAGQFLLLPSDEVLRLGVLGEGMPYARSAERIGDTILAAQGDAFLWWADKENPLSGRHGGLSAEEMLVPLFGMVL